MADKKSLDEVKDLFNDVSTNCPYLSAEVTIKVKMFLIHSEANPEDENAGVSEECTLDIETLPEIGNGDPEFTARVERLVKPTVIDKPYFLDDIIKAFKLDPHEKIWELGYE